ncbi:MAG TPA: hypothetical protein VE985_09775 [Gaiellaceae bacterium]|nr:hypothetical protein [Gaiellaceae bacterium]
MDRLKDEQLVEVAQLGNVAQFVSFDPRGQQRHARIAGFAEDEPFRSVDDAVAALLAVSPERSVNVRAFSPTSPKGNEFLYGLRSADEAAAHVRRLASDGLFTIVNETVDVNDGGVSGVALGHVVEFVPGDTPRGVEKPGVALLARQVAIRLLEVVYGVAPELPSLDGRVEFSLHPLRRGYRHGHTIVWEIDSSAASAAAPTPTWPNHFSSMLGDKVFGLLLGVLLGARVPYSTVISRALAPFVFGDPTGSTERWLRTAPRVSTPGRFTTVRGWTDPFVLLQAEDPDSEIASVLVQDSVEAQFSGAAITQTDNEPLVEGVENAGDEFMLGRHAPGPVPADVRASVRELHDELASSVGSIHLEWAHDASSVWLLQLRQVAPLTDFSVIVPGEPARFRRFDVAHGLETLRSEAEAARERGEGIEVIGDVGITSHFGDVLRQANVPSRLVRVKEIAGRERR